VPFWGTVTRRGASLSGGDLSAHGRRNPPCPTARPTRRRTLRRRRPRASSLTTGSCELLSGPFSGRIRECASDDCPLLFVDTSRPGARRWCAMERRGNRHKLRALRASAPGGPRTRDAASVTSTEAMRLAGGVTRRGGARGNGHSRYPFADAVRGPRRAPGRRCRSAALVRRLPKRRLPMSPPSDLFRQATPRVWRGWAAWEAGNAQGPVAFTGRAGRGGRRCRSRMTRSKRSRE
jgi:hypothetical protein